MAFLVLGMFLLGHGLPLLVRLLELVNIFIWLPRITVQIKNNFYVYVFS